MLFARYVKYKLHQPDHTFHTPTQPLKYTRKIYTHIQEYMGMGANGKFYNTKKLIWVCKKKGLKYFNVLTPEVYIGKGRLEN